MFDYIYKVRFLSYAPLKPINGVNDCKLENILTIIACRRHHIFSGSVQTTSRRKHTIVVDRKSCLVLWRSYGPLLVSITSPTSFSSIIFPNLYQCPPLVPLTSITQSLSTSFSLTISILTLHPFPSSTYHPCTLQSWLVAISFANKLVL